jgi:hypothetical protein
LQGCLDVAPQWVTGLEAAQTATTSKTKSAAPSTTLDPPQERAEPGADDLVADLRDSWHANTGSSPANRPVGSILDAM